MAQEKSRAAAMTAERAARRSVFDISRTMPSSRLDKIEINTESSWDALGLLVAVMILSFTQFASVSSR
jgi:hypothetical protein